MGNGQTEYPNRTPGQAWWYKITIRAWRMEAEKWGGRGQLQSKLLVSWVLLSQTQTEPTMSAIDESAAVSKPGWEDITCSLSKNPGSQTISV